MPDDQTDLETSLRQQWQEVQALPRQTLSEIKSAETAVDAFYDRLSDLPEDIQYEENGVPKLLLKETNNWVYEVLKPAKKLAWNNELESAPDNAKKILGIAPSSAPETDAFTVDYGNHRTAATLILYQQGKIAPDAVIGRMQDAQGGTINLTPASLTELYQEGRLHSSNLSLDGEAGISGSKVNPIVKDFDLSRFFDPARDQGMGIYLRKISPEQATKIAPYSSVIDRESGEPFPHFMKQQVFPDGIENQMSAMSSATSVAQEGGERPVTAAPLQVKAAEKPAATSMDPQQQKQFDHLVEQGYSLTTAIRHVTTGAELPKTPDGNRSLPKILEVVRQHAADIADQEIPKPEHNFRDAIDGAYASVRSDGDYTNNVLHQLQGNPELYEHLAQNFGTEQKFSVAGIGGHAVALSFYDDEGNKQILRITDQTSARIADSNILLTPQAEATVSGIHMQVMEPATDLRLFTRDYGGPLNNIEAKTLAQFVDAKIYDEGRYFSDNHMGNYGVTASGRLTVPDLEAVYDLEATRQKFANGEGLNAEAGKIQMEKVAADAERYASIPINGHTPAQNAGGKLLKNLQTQETSIATSAPAASLAVRMPAAPAFGQEGASSTVSESVATRPLSESPTPKALPVNNGSTEVKAISPHVGNVEGLLPVAMGTLPTEKRASFEMPRSNTQAPNERVTPEPTLTHELPARSNASHAGGAGVGLALGLVGLKNAWQNHDGWEALVSGANVAMSGVELYSMLSKAKALTPELEALLKVSGKANVVLTVVDGTVQISREQGAEHKVQRAGAVGLTAGAGVLAGAAGLGAAGAIAAPLAVGYLADKNIEVMRMRKQIHQEMDAVKTDLQGHGNLQAIEKELSKQLDAAGVTRDAQGHYDLHILANDDKIAKVLTAHEQELEKFVKDNKTYMPTVTTGLLNQQKAIGEANVEIQRTRSAEMELADASLKANPEMAARVKAAVASIKPYAPLMMTGLNGADGLHLNEVQGPGSTSANKASPQTHR